jgi:hypothetical protein
MIPEIFVEAEQRSLRRITQFPKRDRRHTAGSRLNQKSELDGCNGDDAEVSEALIVSLA